METAIKPKNQTKAWTDYSSSNCSSRGTSRERYNKVAEAQNVAKSLSEISQMTKNYFQESPRRRRDEATTRKEQLKEALSVPVQSDKAMRMMRGMGWSGGALGARGNGITEPLMPSLDLARGAGLGHSRNKFSDTIMKKPRKSKIAPAFVFQNSISSPETNEMETDVIVQKTKQLLRENTTLDTIMQAMESIEHPKSIKANVKHPNSTPLNANQQLQPPRNLPKFSKGLLNPENCKGVPSFRHRILQSILELLNTEALFKTFTYKNKICKKKRNFVRHAFMLLDSSRNIASLIQPNEIEIFKEIQNTYRRLPGLSFEALYSSDWKTIQIKKKVPPGFKTPTQQEDSKQVNKEENTVNTEKVTEEIKKEMLLEVKAPTQQENKEASIVNTETITEETVHSYIITSGTVYQGKQPGILKFKVLILLNIMGFLKSLNEEVEITFNKILIPKQRTYIENVVDEINMRIKFGSTPVETQLCAEIKSHVKDAFLSFMFNHQYTVVTLNKHFRFKRLNRPDNVVKRTCQTTVDLDAFTSETISASKLSTNNSTVKENKDKDTENNSEYVAIANNGGASAKEPIVTEFVHNESDSNSYKEDCQIYIVPKLPLGKETCSVLSNYLHSKEMADKAATENNININSDSASKNNLNVTEHSSKKNIGNGNIVLDNNDSKGIDMKRECGNTKTTEENKIIDTEVVNYVVCVDYTEVVVDSGEVTVDINKEKEVAITEFKECEDIHQTMKQAKIVIGNDIEMANQHREIIGIDNTDRMIDKGLSKTEDTIDWNVMVTEDFHSNDCTETVIKDVVQNNAYTSTNENDLNKDIAVYDEPMDEISITEKSNILIVKEDSVKEINKNESEELMNRCESMEEINNIETSTDVEVANMEEENSFPSDDQIVKEEQKMKTDLISKEMLVLSEGFCDTLSVELSHIKTMGTKIKEPENHISKDTEIKTVHIVHANHPIEELTNENIKEIQRNISNSIFFATQLPLLKCHGVQHGALIYSCHNKNTYDWFQNIISLASYVKVLNAREITKMSLRFHCFFDFDIKDLFNMIEWYNQELSTKEWVVEKTEKNGDTLNLIVKMDKFSVKFIQDFDLSLFGGIDKILFTPVWE